MSCYFDYYLPGDDYFAVHPLMGVCRWIVRSEVANVEEGRKLLQRVERYWMLRCGHVNSTTRGLAWKMRIRLHRAGLATETVSDFQTDLLKAIKHETCPHVRMILSTWMPDKDTSCEVRVEWEHLWQKGLESCDEENSRIAAMVLLKPNPADDPVDLTARWQKLQEVLQFLPRPLRRKLSMIELTRMILPLGNGWAAGR